MALTKNNIRDIKINLPLPFLSNVILVCLMLSVSLFVCAESEQEIGEPYFSYETRRHITLAPVGKTFYALDGKKGLVSRYQFSPFKKIDSFEIPKLKFLYGPSSASKVLVSDDGGKLFFYNPKSLMLFDLQANKIIKKIEFDRFSDGAFLSGDRITTLFSGKHSNKPYSSQNVYAFIEFRNWRSNDLSKINNVSYFDGRKYLHSKSRLREFNNIILIRVGDYVLFSIMPKRGFKYGLTHRQPSIAIFDKITLEPLFAASFQDIAVRNSVWGSNLRFSYDFSKAYVLNAEPYNAKAFPNSSHQTAPYKATLEINLKILKIKILTKDWKEIESTTVELRESGRTQHFSQVGDYARKFLKMKDSAGGIVPMNNVTFNKYNQTSSSHLKG